MDVDGMKVNDNMVNKLSLQEHELWKIVPSESDSSLADCDCEILCYVGARFSDCQHATLALIGEQQSLTPTTCIDERKQLLRARWSQAPFKTPNKPFYVHVEELVLLVKRFHDNAKYWFLRAQGSL